MNKTTVSVVILGKSYQVNCPENEVESLKKAACMLEEKMRSTQESGKLLSHDKLAVITSLNLAHQLTLLEQHAQECQQTLYQRLQNLHNKVESVLDQKELNSAE